MDSLSRAEHRTVDWAEVLKGQQVRVAASESSSMESYSTVSAADSLSGSLSSSLVDFAVTTPVGDVGRSKSPRDSKVSSLRSSLRGEEAGGAAAALSGLAAAAASLACSGGSAPRTHHDSSHTASISVAAQDSLTAALSLVASAGASSAAGSHPMLPGSPAGTPQRGMQSGSLPPEVLLAALSASLAAQQQGAQHSGRQRLGSAQQQQPQLNQVHLLERARSAALAAPAVLRAAPAHAAAAALPGGYVCTSCSAVFADEPAFSAHCSSLEHAMAVVHTSLAGELPALAAASRGRSTAAARGAHLAWSSAPVAPAAALPQQAAYGHPLTCNTSALLAGLGSERAAPVHAAQHYVPPPAHASAPFCITSCCNQMIDPQLDLAAHSLLRQLRQLDGVERAVGGHAGRDGGKAVRRLVGGLREVRKAVRSGAAAAVVAAVDIQETNPCTSARRCFSAQPGADIAEICQVAALFGVPVVFALTRLGLGSIFGANKRMSAVALTNVAGLEAPLNQLLSMAAVGRARYAAFVSQGALC